MDGPLPATRPRMMMRVRRSLVRDAVCGPIDEALGTECKSALQTDVPKLESPRFGNAQAALHTQLRSCVRVWDYGSAWHVVCRTTGAKLWRPERSEGYGSGFNGRARQHSHRVHARRAEGAEDLAPDHHRLAR
jgi:hypothetical protein